MRNMTGRPGYRTMEMIGGSSAPYLARTPCVPLFCTLSNRGGNRRAFRLPGTGRDHFHCTVEPSSSHIRCRIFRVIFRFSGYSRSSIPLPFPKLKNRQVFLHSRFRLYTWAPSPSCGLVSLQICARNLLCRLKSFEGIFLKNLSGRFSWRAPNPPSSRLPAQDAPKDQDKHGQI